MASQITSGWSSISPRVRRGGLPTRGCSWPTFRTDWEYSEFAVYDLGQAVAHMSFQAQALGLQVRQFRAFDRAGLTAEFAVPDHWEVTTMSAIGRVPQEVTPPTVDVNSALARQRRSPDEIRWPQASTTDRR